MKPLFSFVVLGLACFATGYPQLHEGSDAEVISVPDRARPSGGPGIVLTGDAGPTRSFFSAILRSLLRGLSANDRTGGEPTVIIRRRRPSFIPLFSTGSPAGGPDEGTFGPGPGDGDASPDARPQFFPDLFNFPATGGDGPPSQPRRPLFPSIFSRPLFPNFFRDISDIPNFGELPPNYDNSTHEVTHIDGRRVEVNQTTTKESGDGGNSFFHVKVIRILPPIGSSPDVVVGGPGETTPEETFPIGDMIPGSGGADQLPEVPVEVAEPQVPPQETVFEAIVPESAIDPGLADIPYDENLVSDGF